MPDEPLGPLKRTDGDPVFDEAWQAQALAIADSLVKRGTFSAAAWATALGKEVHREANDGEADDALSYYRAVVAALESILDDTGTATRDEVDVRRDQWEQAYLDTPHGKPVKLNSASTDDE